MRWCLLLLPLVSSALAEYFVNTEGSNAKDVLTFRDLIGRVDVGGIFDITVIGPVGSTDNVSLSVAKGSQGNGTLEGPLEAQLDGGDPYSSAVFTGIKFDRTGLYKVAAKANSAAGVSDFIQVIPSVQCNNLPWDTKSTCSNCVSLFDFDCVYCNALEACLPGGIYGADEKSTCKEFYLHVCWVRGDYATLIFPAAACILAFFVAGYCVCVCCGRSRQERQQLLDDYDRRFNIARQRSESAAGYGATASGTARTEEMRRKMEAKYNTPQPER